METRKKKHKQIDRIPRYLLCLSIALANLGCGGGGGSGGFIPDDNSYIESLAFTKNGDQVNFSWTMLDTGDDIVLYRGDVEIATLAGDATSYTYNESSFGYIRFSATLNIENKRVDREQVFIDFGTVKWDPPSGNVEGYLLYVVEAVGDPYYTLPYDNPYAYSYDVGLQDELNLLSLYNSKLIGKGTTTSFYLAASSYLHYNSELLISPLTDPLTFDYEVVLALP